MDKLSIKELLTCYGKRILFQRGSEIAEENLPSYEFNEDEVTYILNTTNNTLRTPIGFFRICFEHIPKVKYLEMLRVFYDKVPIKQQPEKGLNYFLKKGMRDWFLNGKRNQYQTYNVCSSMAEEEVAQLLGLENLLTKSHFCKIRIGEGMVLYGSMSSDARGVDVRELKDCFREVYTPSLAKDLTSLNLVDSICYEKDHRPGNYHIILDDNGKAVSICSFDNDSPFSFAPFGGAAFKTYAGASEIIKKGQFNRPLLDNNVSERLLSLNRNDIQKSLGVYIGRNQVNACWKRVVELQKALKNTQFIFDDWTEDVMMEELSGKFGNTYYSVLYHLSEAIEQGKY